MVVFYGFPTSWMKILFATESPWRLRTAIPSGTVLKIDSVRVLVYKCHKSYLKYTFELVCDLKLLLVIISDCIKVWESSIK